MSLEASASIPDEVVFRELDGETVLLNLTSGVYFGLDEVGTRIWHLIGEHRNLGAVIEALSTEYDADRAEIEKDVLDLTEQLLAKSLLTLDAPAG